jgi:hypothetical protein
MKRDDATRALQAAFEDSLKKAFGSFPDALNAMGQDKGADHIKDVIKRLVLSYRAASAAIADNIEP